ncbi:site-specific DNA-methyltransferase (plasmid) [Ralstonia solanacearum]|uniref:Site-specific DNA-methyltransferase n=1 Tax=Ralstonia solanacearum TaxID=305 RepID=A0AAD0WIS7_RALSL|nr:site-specific DNA-methyltransferase [Ralstonia solanacearum]AXW55656.1 site-specific DNA-methyltransferase [Ralstonia solanacearum]
MKVFNARHFLRHVAARTLPEVPEDPISRPGDVWVLGRHRLLCGDATVAQNYDRLLQGEPADMVFTDPS